MVVRDPPSTIRKEDRLFLIDRLVALAFDDDEILDTWGSDMLGLIQHVACGTWYEPTPAVEEFLLQRFPRATDLIWAFVVKKENEA
jgi:hypothetical protein